MRTRSAAVIAHCAQGGVSPGYLIRIDYTPALYLSTLGAVTWPTDTTPQYTWARSNIIVSGNYSDGAGLTDAAISVANADGVMGALVLSQGAKNIPVTIWEQYAGLTAEADVTQIFTGVTNGVDFDLPGGRVNFPLEPLDDSTMQSPRSYLDSLSGYGYMKAPGSVIIWGGETFVLEPVGSPVLITR